MRAIIICLVVLISTHSMSQNIFDSLVFVNSSGHSSYVQHAAISENKKYILTSSWDNKCILWDLITSKQLLEYSGHSNGIIKAIFHPNGKETISASYDGYVFNWDLNSGKLIDTLYYSQDIIQNIEISENGKYLAVIYENETIILKYENPQPIIQKLKHSSSNSFYSEKRTLLYTAFENKVVKIDLNHPYIQDSIMFDDVINRFHLLNENNLAICFKKDKNWRIYDLNDSIFYYNLTKDLDVNLNAIKMFNKHILTITKDEKIRLINIENDSVSQPYNENKYPIWSSFINDESFIIYASDKISTDEILIFKTSKDYFLKKISIQVKGMPLSFTYDKELNLLIVTYTDYSTRIIDFDEFKIKELKGRLMLNYGFIDHGDSINISSFYSDKDPLLATQSGSINLNTKSLALDFLTVHAGWIKNHQIDNKKDRILTVSKDSLLNEILISTNSIIRSYKFNDVIKKAFFTPDKNKVILVFRRKIGVFDWEKKRLKIYFDNLNTIQDVCLTKNKIVILYSSEIVILTNDFKFEKLIQTPTKGFSSLETSKVNQYIISKSSEQLLAIDPNEKTSVIHLITPDKSEHGIHCLKLDSTDFLLTHLDNKIKLIDIQANKAIQTFDAKGEIIGSQQLSDTEIAVYLSYQDSIQILKIRRSKIEIKKFKAKHSFVFSAYYNVSNDILFVSFSDKTNYLYNYKNGECIMIYMLLENNNWLVKLPNTPFYMCSKDGSKMLHYVTPGLKVIGFEQLDPVYNRPAIVLDSIGKHFGGTDQELITNYRMSWEKRIDRLGLNIDNLGKGEIAVPNAEILRADAIDYENKNGKLEIKVSAKDPKYYLTRFNIYINEVPQYGSSGISIAHLNKQEWDTTITITLSEGENKIQVSILNNLGLENFKIPTYVNYSPLEKSITKTYYIAIAVNEFKEAGHNLKYCVKDVIDLANWFNGPNTIKQLFTNTQVTKENIIYLKKYLMENTNVNDKVIISCSSHGLLDDSLNFYLAMHDVEFNNPKSRGLKYEELESLLDGIPARQKLLLLDACNSGENDKINLQNHEFENTTSSDTRSRRTQRGIIIRSANEGVDLFKKMNELFVNVRNNTGSIIISAAGGLQAAKEGESVIVDGRPIHNGAFTFCVLEYLKKEKNPSVNGLKKHVEKRVQEITLGEQVPTSRQETMEVDWEF